jgi:hypothetical protein
MKRTITLLACPAVLCLASCEKDNNEFVVRDPANVVASATVELCGKSSALAKSAGMLTGKIPAKCEGSGTILIRLSDGREARCPVGYVTYLEQRFEYVVEEGACRGNQQAQ